ncbi:MAG: DUF4369 domain-containing protein [Muribaculaceae bacterium]|nr:DUF4369 domain-containing protein [Muribaculaceae bacterium]
MNRFSSTILIILSLILFSCGGGDTFHVIGEVENLGTQNLRVIYRADGKLRQGVATAVDGKFSFEGSSRDETMLHIFTNQYLPIGVIFIRNGETVEARFDRDDPFKLSVKGNSSSADLATFLSRNAATLASSDAVGINALVEKYVASNPSRLSSTYLLTNFYRTEGNERRADSILRLIDQKARPSVFVQGWLSQFPALPDSVASARTLSLISPADSLVIVSLTDTLPTLFAFSDRVSPSPLAAVADDSTLISRIRLIEISVSPDTAAWKASVRNLSGSAALPRHYWLPAAVASPALRHFSPAAIPFYVLTDTAGSVIYRADSLSVDHLNRLIR